MNIPKFLLSGSILCFFVFSNVAHAQQESFVRSLQQVANNLNANKNSGNNKVVENDSREVIKTEKYKWKSGYKDNVGEMELKYFNDKTVLININTVCGTHPCFVEDVKGILNNNIIEVNEKKEEMIIQFKIKLMKNRAIIEHGDNDESLHYFCGMRAGFGGEYIKK